MKASKKWTPLLFLTGVSSLLVAQPAWAGCGDFSGKQQTVWEQDATISQSNLAQKIDWGGASDNSIVGMWAFKFTANGTPVDFGYVQWHSDGTELMNSGGRAPATENFCMGVWKRTGPSQFHLNHFALSYDMSGKLDARVNIKEDVTVDRSNLTYQGTFTIDVYDPNTNRLLQHLGGQVTGQRVPAD